MPVTHFERRIYRKQVLDLVSSQTPRVKAVFVLIIQSGALYCGSWVSVVAYFRQNGRLTVVHQLALAVVYISTRNGLYVVLQLITQLTVSTPYSLTCASSEGVHCSGYISYFDCCSDLHENDA